MRVWIGLLVLVAGCRIVDPPPDPNDPTQVGLMQPEVLRQNLKVAANDAMTRVREGQIGKEQAEQLIQDYAAECIRSIDLNHIPLDQAWEYAEVFIAAKNWPLAKGALEAAVPNSPSEERRVNDSLRLACALSNLGEIERAIATARSVFDTPDDQAAPILLAVLYEIVPPAEGGGHDVELARLIEDAVTHHLRVRVDRRTQPGQDFFMARPFHVRKAWSDIVRLYEQAGETELARQARERGRISQQRLSSNARG